MVIKKILAKFRLVTLYILNFSHYMLNFFKHPKPVFPKNNTSGLKINLGAGNINMQGWINIDARNLAHIHLVTNTLQLSEFSDNSISEIYLCHVLEHFSFHDVEKILVDIHKKLKVNGLIRISVPSFDALVEVYLNNARNLEIIKFALMGGQNYEYNFHKAVFNRECLTNLLIKNGYTNPMEWKTQDDFGIDLGDWSNKYYLTKKNNVQISLNIKAKKIDKK